MAGVVTDRPIGPRDSALMRLTLTELKLFTRMRTGLVFSIGLPLLLLVILGSIPSFNQPRSSLNGYTLLDAFVPILIAMVLALLSLSALPMVLAGYRERGVLRRLQTTPVGAGRMLAAQLLVNLAATVVTVIMLLVVARSGFGVFLPRQLGGFIITVLLAAVALMAMGLFIAAVAPSGRAAQVIGGLLFYPMMFFAGLYLPIPEMPADLQHISHATPLGAAVQALTDAATGLWPHPLQLLTLAAYAVVFGLAAIALFRWE